MVRRGRGGEGGLGPDPYRGEAYWGRVGQPLPPQPLPGLDIPRARRGDVPAYSGILPNWAVYGEVPQPLASAYNADGKPAPLAGIRIHRWGPAPQPFVVQPPLQPHAPVNAVENEMKLAQNRVLQEAYKNAPPQVQARCGNQMRRRTKDSDLDGATGGGYSSGRRVCGGCGNRWSCWCSARREFACSDHAGSPAGNG